MTETMIDYEVNDGIATIAWNMAARPVNVINAESLAAFAAAVDKALADKAVAGVIVTSGKADFIAGADVHALVRARDPAQVMESCLCFHDLARRIETGGKPFVAAINGTALARGFELCLACHYRIAADDPRIRIGLPEVKLGLIPGGGGTQRLPRMIGMRAALPLMIDGRELAPAAALENGLIDATAPADGLLDAAKAWLDGAEADPVKPWDRKGFKVPGGGPWSPAGMQRLTVGNAQLRARTWGNYPAPKAIASCVYEGLQVPIDTGLRIESRWFANVLLGDVARNMIRTFFFHVREANKLHRRANGVPPNELRKVGVLGAGLMGSGIAHAAASAGFDVVLLDISEALAEDGKAAVSRLLDKQAGKGRVSTDEAAATLARIRPTADFADLDGADIVIEAVFEDRAVKAEVTGKAEAVIGENAVFASNSSTLPIAGLAKASARPERFLGLHFFSPVDRMKLIEIIRGPQTSEACLTQAMRFIKRIAKTPIVVNDSRGFYTSRVFATYIQEGLAMLADGVWPALIENCGRLAGMPIGPLAVADAVSLGLIHKVARQTRADLGDAYIAPPGAPVIETMVETLGRLGKKAGKGFYDYPADRPKHLWPGLDRQFPPRPIDDQPDAELVKRRLLYIQAVETARCLEEKVVTSTADADVGSVLGWGFAPQTGGVLSLIDTVGAAPFVAACDRLAERLGPRFAPPTLLRDMAANGKRFHPELPTAG